jgi:hypothetical protein
VGCSAGSPSLRPPIRVEDGRAVHGWASCGQADGRARRRVNQGRVLRSSGCPQRTLPWSGVGVSTSSRRPIGRHGNHERTGDKATRHPARLSWMPRPRRSVSKSGKHTAQRRAVRNDDIAPRREALHSPRTTSISMGRLPHAPACGGLGAGCEPGPCTLRPTSDPSPETRRWTHRPRRRGRGVRYRGRPRP